MIGRSIMTRPVLSEQDYDSRRRNIQAELFRQLEMNFGVHAGPDPAERLADLGLLGTNAHRLGDVIERHFPFVNGATTIVERSHNFDDLVRFILEKI